MTPANHAISCKGYCRRCKTEHQLPFGNAMQQARRLMAELETNQTIAPPAHHAQNDPGLSTSSLFSDPRGKMFGVLECLSERGEQLWLYSFSGQYNGQWLVSGWAGPLFDVATYQGIHDPAERKIKELTARIVNAPARMRSELRTERSGQSQQLMQRLHALYRLNNFRGQTASFDEVLGTSRNKPTGLGDCCAPKLLNQAARAGLVPVSLAEFYFGRQNRSSTRLHKSFYPACTSKCRPLLGFMLCGAEETVK